MKNLTHDLFLLMLQLSELSNPDRIFRLFLESINSLWEEISFELLDENQEGWGEIVEISTPHHIFGRIAIGYKTDTIPPEIKILCRNAIHMLALILENLHQRNQLSSDKERLEEIVNQRTADVLEREEQYRALVENLEDIIIRYGRDCIPLYISPSFSRILNKLPEDCIGKSHREQGFSKTISSFWEKHIRKVFETGTPFRSQFIIQTTTGPAIFDWRLYPEFDNRGKVKTVLSASRDITDLRRTEIALKESEQKYRFLIESLNEGIWVIDPDRNTTFVNSRMAEMVGYTVEVMIGRPIDSFMDDASQSFFQRNLKQQKHGDKNGQEYTLIRSDGEKIFVRLLITPLVDSEGAYIGTLAGVEDITDRKKAESENKRLEDQYRQAQKMEAIGQLAGGVAHDFNNLLMVINGYTDMAMSALYSTDAPIHAQLEQVRQAANRATILVRQLMTFSRREAIQREYLILNDLIAGILKMLRRVIGEHIQLEFNPGENILPIYVDPGQIEQILMNLCINSRDAMPNGGIITIETQNIAVENLIHQNQNFTNYKEFVMLSVSDTGMGIHPEALEHIFEPFFTTKEEGKGTGLGLATVYGIVTQHEGIIDVESDVGRGASFSIYLPVSQKEENTGKEEKPIIQEQTTLNPGKGTVFVAEDEEAVRKLIIRVLEKNGFTVIAAKDGLEAILLINQFANEIQLAILDVVMPLKNGKEVAEYLQSKNPEIPLILMSGYDFNLLESIINSQERKTILHKPFNPLDLVKLVQERIWLRD